TGDPLQKGVLRQPRVPGAVDVGPLRRRHRPAAEVEQFLHTGGWAWSSRTRRLLPGGCRVFAHGGSTPSASKPAADRAPCLSHKEHVLMDENITAWIVR